MALMATSATEAEMQRRGIDGGTERNMCVSLLLQRTFSDEMKVGGFTRDTWEIQKAGAGFSRLP